MKSVLLALVAFVSLTAEVTGETRYTSIISGVSIGKGRVHVWETLTNTFKAYQIRIKEGKDSKPIRWATIPDYVIVTFTSKNDKITRSQVEKAVKAPSKSGKLYLVWKLEREGEKEL